MSRQGRLEYLRGTYPRYQQTSRLEKQRILDEFCEVTRNHRMSARRPPTHGMRVIRLLAVFGYFRQAPFPDLSAVGQAYLRLCQPGLSGLWAQYT